MNATLTIQEFHALLNSQTHDQPWLEALRKLMQIEKPEDVAVLKKSPMWIWSGWAA